MDPLRAATPAGALDGGRERPLRFALYSHDTLGLGHVRRNLRIARALTFAFPRANALLVCGAGEAAGLTLPPRVDCLTLPALRKLDGDVAYAPRRLAMPVDAVLRVRARTLAAALVAYAPDVLIVDKAPRGVAGELDDALSLVKRQGTRCVLGLRDVLDDPARVAREWEAARAADAVRTIFDAVWVYGDPSVYDVRRECPVPSDVAAKFRFTGYLGIADGAEPDPFPDLLEGLPPGRCVLCLVGGGEDGAPLADAFLRARFPADVNAVVVLGPFMPDDERRRVTAIRSGPRVRVMSTADGTCALTRRADFVVAMAGYNTVCDILSHRKPALLVPRVRPLREQWIRAECFRQRGLVEVLHPDALDPSQLAAWVARAPVALDAPIDLIDLGGAQRIPHFVDDLLAGDGASADAPSARTGPS